MPSQDYEEIGLLERLLDSVETQGPWLGKSSAFTDALRKGEEAFQAEQWGEAEKFFLKAHELFPDYMGPNSPLRQLAGLYRN